MRYYNVNNEEINITKELYHYGVKGMKWGVRRSRDVGSSTGSRKQITTKSDVAAAKKAMKAARKDYNKAFNKAYNRAFAAYSPSKKHREANDQRWDDAFDKGAKYCEAKKNYKTMKKNYKKCVDEESKKILAGESFANKVWDLYTGGHKIQSELNINLRDYED